MRARKVLIGAIVTIVVDVAIVLALFGLNGDPPDAFVVVFSAVFWGAVAVAAVSAVLVVLQLRNGRGDRLRGHEAVSPDA